ncbi:MAG: fibrinogen-like YCDxxxxGGGW domain-containing protein [Polyangiales bacterium]
MLPLALLGLAACAETSSATSSDATADVPAADRAASSDVPTIDTPPADIPPTDIPPTDIPPTDIPPTDTPPTDTPSTDIPSTDIPSTDIPSTDIPATDVPAADVPPEATADVPPVCLAGTADCDGNPGNGCEVTLRSDGANCGACGVRCCGPCIDGQCWADGVGLTVCGTGPGGCRNFPRNLLTDPAACGACDHACATGEVCSDGACVAPPSCRAILQGGWSTGDGVYAITLAGARTMVRCLMSADGGGWTQVMNLPTGAPPSAIPGWNSGDTVGTSFTEVSAPWRLSDAQINALRRDAYRARGTASRCLSGACALDVTLYWRGACELRSTASSTACATAFTDLAFTAPTGNTAPCAWHAGLTDTRCGSRGGISTHHPSDGIVACVGEPGSFVHACSGRGAEDPGLAVWVR